MPKSREEIMSKPHWAVIEKVTVHHEGDLRSQMNPGHGYPAHTTTHDQYTPYETEEEMLDRYGRKRSHETLIAIKAEPLVIKTELTAVAAHS